MLTSLISVMFAWFWENMTPSDCNVKSGSSSIVSLHSAITIQVRNHGRCYEMFSIPLLRHHMSDWMCKAIVYTSI